MLIYFSATFYPAVEYASIHSVVIIRFLYYSFLFYDLQVCSEESRLLSVLPEHHQVLNWLFLFSLRFKLK